MMHAIHTNNTPTFFIKASNKIVIIKGQREILVGALNPINEPIIQFDFFLLVLMLL